MVNIINNDLKIWGACPALDGMEGMVSVIVALFPYFTGWSETTSNSEHVQTRKINPNFHNIYESGNISLYARSLDYHSIIKDKLNCLGNKLKKYDNTIEYTAYVDNHPFNERQIALQVGLGVIGKNRCLIHSDFGSYVFIGLLAVNKKLEYHSPIESACKNCNKCIKACPNNAITENGFNISNCLSYITQKKGELSSEEAELIKKQKTIWGCDICQQVCPHNADPKPTYIKEFELERINTLNLSDIQGLSNKQFNQKYKKYAFAYKGKHLLVRNLTL